MTWIILAAYAALTLLTARKINYVMRASEPADDHATTDETVMLGFLAFLAGLFWPLALPIAIIMWKPHKTPAELQDEIAERDARIAELEREAGIRQ